MVQLRECFPFWKALTKEQQNTMEESAVKRTFEIGTLLHAGEEDCVHRRAVS